MTNILRGTHSQKRFNGGKNLMFFFLVVVLETTAESHSLWAPPKEYFPRAVEKRIGEEGGVITHPYASIEIPPGALDTQINITLQIEEEMRLTPYLVEGEILLTPVVSCRPHGLRFKKPVSLTIAHCAHMTGGIFNNSVLISQEASSPMWRNLLQDEGLVRREIHATSIVLFINHFSEYAFVGEAKTIVLHVVAYTNSPAASEFLESRIKFAKDFSRSWDFGVLGSFSHPHFIEKERQPYIFHVGRGDLGVALTKFPEEWHPVGGRHEKIDSDLILYGVEPSCLFVMKPTSNAGNEMYLEVEYYQTERVDKVQRLKFTAYKYNYSSSIFNYIVLFLICGVFLYKLPSVFFLPPPELTKTRFLRVKELSCGMLLDLAQRITNERDLRTLATNGLGIEHYQVDRVLENKKDDIAMAAHALLIDWKNSQCNNHEAYRNMHGALENVQMTNLINVALR